jgi:hypothetical protein
VDDCHFGYIKNFEGKKKTEKNPAFQVLISSHSYVREFLFFLIISQTILEKRSIMNFSCIGSNIYFPNFDVCIYGDFKCIIDILISS